MVAQNFLQLVDGGSRIMPDALQYFWNSSTRGKNQEVLAPRPQESIWLLCFYPGLAISRLDVNPLERLIVKKIFAAMLLATAVAFSPIAAYADGPPHHHHHHHRHHHHPDHH